MQLQNMSLVTELQPILRRDYEVKTKGLVDPLNSTGSATNPLALLDGEFLMFDASGKVARQGRDHLDTGGVSTVNPSVAGGVSLIPSFPVFAELGRTDTQVLSMTTILFTGSGFEADFSEDILHASDVFAVGDILYVNWLANGANANRRRGLTKIKNAGDAGWVAGHVTYVYPSGSPYKIRARIIL